jgi:pimeloyl-ACP methyl ester carboxylesterase
MAMAKLNDVAIHYESMGTSPDVVMLHGLASNLAFWHFGFAVPLSRRYRVTTFDLRGHGMSEMPSKGYTSRDMVKDLLALMDHIGIERAHLVGHSFGGAVALHCAVMAPHRVKTLTLADPWVGVLQPSSREARERFWARWRQRFVELGMDMKDQMPLVVYGMMEELLHTGRARTQPTRPHPDPSVANSRLLRRWRRLIESTSIVGDLWSPAGLTPQKISSVLAPALVTWGEFSTFQGSARRLARLLPSATGLVIRGAGHAHPTSAPASFIHHILRFLRCHP